MTNSRPEIFGGARCEWVASYLGKQTELCWIFSVCSDGRIPEKLEHRLGNVYALDVPTHLIILGDFPLIPPERCPASFEVIRLLAEAANFRGAVQVCWLEGETINISSTSPPNFTWHKFFFDVQQRVPHIWPVMLPVLESERRICDEIIHLLDRQPGILLSEEGYVERLNLTDGEPYRRSLAGGLSYSKQNQLWSLILRLPNLRELKAGFSGLYAVPDLSRLQYLEILDLRGNPKIRLDQLSKATSLKKINAAACELEYVPHGIERLTNLHTLLLHKNSILDVSTIAFPPLLERISLYRNRISSGSLDLTRCDGITEVNLGANPISDMVVNISDTVMRFSLRLRHVNNKVRVAWRGAMGINPACICDH